MRALVVYESMFGNTQAVAQALARGLDQLVTADLAEVSTAPTILGDDVSLLLVGGPTHAFGLSRDSTRRDAATKTARGLVSPGIGIREWLSRIGHPRADVAAVAFDTKIDQPWLPGSAAGAAHKRLRWLRFRMITAPESFLLTDPTGPLLDGELDRALAWGQRVGAIWAKGNRFATRSA